MNAERRAVWARLIAHIPDGADLDWRKGGGQPGAGFPPREGTMLNKDTGATIAGGGAGYLLLQSVQWGLVGVHPGETIKVGVALAMILGGYLAYRGA